MLHIAVRAVERSVIFRDWIEARALWDAIVARVSVVALVLMPDHLHALLRDERSHSALSAALGAYAQWRNHRRGARGAVFRHRERAMPVGERQHVERSRRYVHLNPCRAGLVADPLAWPFSTHRDATGLALPVVRPPARDPARFHAFVSADPSASIDGSPLPLAAPPAPASAPSIVDVQSAVSALTRLPLSALRRPCPERVLFMHAAVALTTAQPADVADAAGASLRTLRRVVHATTWRPSREIALVARVIGDARFAALTDGDLRRTAAWVHYRGFR